jgi:ABC-2 type transport system ATP-binding protein
VPEQPLVAQGFGRRYRRDRPWAVRDLSFSVPEGSITALVGPNGAGKSTLIRACLGFEAPDAGRLLVFGADPRLHRETAVSAIGFIPQSSALYRGLTIGDHFTMAERARPRFDRQFASRRMEESDLGEKRKVGELSGGEQAQVALALAIGTQAPLLLLDEPLASLDPLARRDFVTALRVGVRQRHATAIISSHLIADVEQISDGLIVLADGRLALSTSIAEARSRFSVAVGRPTNGQVVVGEFSDPNGQAVVLVAGGDIGRPATLEEIVLGHLAAARTARRPMVS